MNEYVYVVFLVGQTPQMLDGFFPLLVESCSDAITALTPVVERVMNSAEVITDYNLECFKGTEENFIEHLKSFEFKPKA